MPLASSFATSQPASAAYGRANRSRKTSSYATMLDVPWESTTLHSEMKGQTVKTVKLMALSIRVSHSHSTIAETHQRDGTFRFLPTHSYFELITSRFGLITRDVGLRTKRTGLTRKSAGLIAKPTGLITRTIPRAILRFWNRPPR